MRFRRKRILKAAVVFLVACFVCGVILHSQTDSDNIGERRSNCNGQLCFENLVLDSAVKPIASVIDPAVRIGPSKIADGIGTKEPRREVASDAGPGEMGKPVIIDKVFRKDSQKLFNIYSLNYLASDMISLNRTLPDVRPQGCAALKYPQNLPKTSLVVVFHNEAWSTLWRTIHSVINRSPSCMQEIVLVEDASTQDHLKGRLDQYANSFNFDIKIVRLKKRSGLALSRLRGAERATGEILVFLDSPCEVIEGWLEPLVSRILEDRSNVVQPVIDAIDNNTFEYMKGDGTPQIGGFSWGLFRNWRGMFIPDRKAWYKNKTIPLRSPTMAGGLFAIDKGFFNKLGGYDTGFKVWGAEHLDISFKIWMCGGSLETIPCSRVGHIFRHYSNGGPGGFRNRNKRLAEVWLGDYKEFFYLLNPTIQDVDGGDISDMIALKHKLNCKSFGWFLENIFPETTWPIKDTVFGQIRNIASSQCLDNYIGREMVPLKSWTCQNNPNGQQLWSFTTRGEIKNDEKCLDSVNYEQVVLNTCHFSGGNQKWSFNKETQHITHLNGRCLDLVVKNDGKGQPTMNVCDLEKKSQKWALDITKLHFLKSDIDSKR